MPAYKDEKTGKWYCQFYCKDWTGKNKHIVKRGFDKKKDALDYERKFKNAAKHQDVYFEELIEEYIKKMQHKVRATTLERINTVIHSLLDFPYHKSHQPSLTNGNISCKANKRIKKATPSPLQPC